MNNIINFTGGFELNEAALKEEIENLVSEKIREQMQYAAKTCVTTAVSLMCHNYAKEASEKNYPIYRNAISLINNYVAIALDKDKECFSTDTQRIVFSNMRIADFLIENKDCDTKNNGCFVRLVNCLYNSFGREANLGDIIQHPYEELIKIPNIGKQSLALFTKMLKKHNLKLGKD